MKFKKRGGHLDLSLLPQRYPRVPGKCSPGYHDSKRSIGIVEHWIIAFSDTQMLLTALWSQGESGSLWVSASEQAIVLCFASASQPCLILHFCFSCWAVCPWLDKSSRVEWKQVQGRATAQLPSGAWPCSDAPSYSTSLISIYWSYGIENKVTEKADAWYTFQFLF